MKSKSFWIFFLFVISWTCAIMYYNNVYKCNDKENIDVNYYEKDSLYRDSIDYKIIKEIKQKEK